MGLGAPWHMGPSQIRHQTHASCIGKWILYHWAPREALVIRFKYSSVYMSIPNSLSPPLTFPPPHLCNHKLMLKVCKSVSVLLFNSLSFKTNKFYLFKVHNFVEFLICIHICDDEIWPQSHQTFPSQPIPLNISHTFAVFPSLCAQCKQLMIFLSN